MEAMLGYIVSFPDTSNTWYQTHCLAATELIVNPDIYIQLLLLIKDKKESRMLNHMERNVLAGLQDIPTIHELCVLVVYSQSISMPYLRKVRGNTLTNVLDLGPLHQKVADHCRKVIVNPELLVGPDATHTSGSLDGSVWTRPDAMYGVLRLAPTLPHLRPLVQAFFEGALETWLRFSAEFVEGGAIDGTTASERRQAWMQTTNDLNEGALGSFRKAARDDGSMSLLYYNGKTMYKRNDTAIYMQTLAPDEQRFIRSKARTLDSSQLARGSRQKQIAYDQAHVDKKHTGNASRKQRKEEHKQRMNNLVVILSLEELSARNLNVADIDAQLDWHRIWGPESTIIPVKTKCGIKAARIEILRAAITRFNESGKRLEDCLHCGEDDNGPDDVEMPAVENSRRNRECDTDTDME
jgi:hypothetical protein